MRIIFGINSVTYINILKITKPILLSSLLCSGKMEQIEGLLLSTKSSVENFQSRERTNETKCVFRIHPNPYSETRLVINVYVSFSFIFFIKIVFEFHQKRKDKNLALSTCKFSYITNFWLLLSSSNAFSKSKLNNN